ncbi:MAG: rubrerythrin family protein [Nanoarchaeota archaeon]|nr:rubrerythrin family protein [Nanoarchaeota archaeon]
MKETLKNLTKAFIGESQARNRYTFYSKIAKKEGYEKIAEIFLLTANQEKEHAKRIFEHIQELKKELGGEEEILIEATAPLVYGTTEENLEAAANGEKYEYSEMYPEFAETAEKEGLKKIAERLRSIAVAEQNHEDRYLKLLQLIKNKTYFKRQEERIWVCRECGYVHIGKEPPKECPSCNHSHSYFEIKQEDY